MFHSRIAHSLRTRSWFLVLMVCLPNLALAQSGNYIAYIKLSQFKVGGVTLGSPLSAAIKAFGKPDSVLRVSNESDSLQEHMYYFDRVTASIIDDKVSQLECTNPKYKTPQGVRVGDTYDRLIGKLGSSRLWKAEGRMKVTYVLWPPSDTFMTFEFQERQIAAIILEYNP